MTGADLLKACRRQKALVTSYEEKIKQLEAEKGLIKSPSFEEAVQTSRKADVSDILIQIDENIAAERKALEKLKKLERVAAFAISQYVNDELIQAVLRNRYLLYKNVTETACAVGYGEDYVKRLQNEGLHTLETVMYQEDTLRRIL